MAGSPTQMAISTPRTAPYTLQHTQDPAAGFGTRASDALHTPHIALHTHTQPAATTTPPPHTTTHTTTTTHLIRPDVPVPGSRSPLRQAAQPLRLAQAAPYQVAGRAHAAHCREHAPTTAFNHRIYSVFIVSNHVETTSNSLHGHRRRRTETSACSVSNLTVRVFVDVIQDTQSLNVEEKEC